MRALLLGGILVLVAAVGVVLGLASIGFDSPPVRGHALASGSGAAPFAVGSCFYATNPGELRPASCAGDTAVFVINAVGHSPADCTAIADFGKFGAVQQDLSAGVVYCVSLLVDANACLVLGDKTAPHRVNCGTDPAASRVVRVTASLNAASACTDLPNADIWYYRSPSSGQVACLTRDGS